MDERYNTKLTEGGRHRRLRLYETSRVGESTEKIDEQLPEAEGAASGKGTEG